MKKLLEKLLNFLRSTAIGTFFAREIPPSKWIRRVLVSVCVFLLTLAVAMTLLDPCFHYHTWKFIPRIYTQPYWQIPGVLQKFEYDSVIVGSSTAQNFDLALFRRELGVNPVKATASACYSHSGRTFAETAIGYNPKLKRIYYGLDLFIFFSPADFDKQPLPDFLYTRTHYKDYCYWWNYDIMFMFLQDVQRKFPNLIKRDGQFTNPDIMFAPKYRKDIKTHGRIPVVRSIQRNTFRQTAQLPAGGRDTAVKCFNDNLETNFIPLVKNNPSVEFVFYFAPSSALNFADAKSCGILDLFLLLRQMIAERLLAFPNVRLYDFQVAPETLSLDNYKDMTHYVPDLNDKIVKWMRQDKYVVRTPADMAENNRLISDYADRLMPLWQSLLKEAEEGD